jgi:pimeloyl-ACP methyl ester carboxylesterase
MAAIHGMPFALFVGQAMKLADRAIAYDRRGFGRSDQPFGDYGYDSLSDDLSDVMTAIES